MWPTPMEQYEQIIRTQTSFMQSSFGIISGLGGAFPGVPQQEPHRNFRCRCGYETKVSVKEIRENPGRYYNCPRCGDPFFMFFNIQDL